MDVKEFAAVIEVMEMIGATVLRAEASGCGDEGKIDSIDLFDAEGFAVEVPEGTDIDDLIDDLFDKYDFDFRDGCGGVLKLEIDLTSRVAKWDADVYEEVLNDWGDEEISL